MKLKLLHKKKEFEIYIPDLGTTQKLPYFDGGVSAGFPSPAEDYMHSKLDLNNLLIEHPSATYYVRVNGNSMLGAGILNGDLLIVDRSLEVTNNCIVVAYIDGEFTVKKLRRLIIKCFYNLKIKIIKL